MFERAGAALRIIAQVVCLSLWMAGGALADCGNFQPLQDLAIEMRSAADTQAPPGLATVRRMAGFARNIELDHVRRRLQRMDMLSQYGHVVQLVNSAADYSRAIDTGDRAALDRTLRNVERLLDLVCASRVGDQPNKRVTAANLRRHSLASLDIDGSALGIGLLLVALFGTIGLLYVSKLAWAYANGFVNHRTICRIPARVCGNGQDFPGLVTRAGLNGVRFEFESDATAKRLTDLMAAPGFVYFDLWIDDESWPVFVDGFHKFFSPLYFLTRLKRSELRAILTKSTRALQIAPEIGMATTKRKWRARIKQRKAEIENARRQRAFSGQKPPR